ncbi:AbrB/MazE/SpoVT family DNA-binding domain-containing protein [Variovorax paradoxus]|uniref:AbrB/MazE/SpoVT family DNA-binding domain-containing protein n=1 Tax=Variovorax paradoxus TaxID=34073 RepID=A0A5Q0LXL3_VARPD|nr:MULTISPECIES: AbrB/MazE/SpoVT family DNA-binding domain-containing protein [Variovorax]QFZ81297.1 AbrB/MazE/SpoVT family DNA-binding domain-containing protein [Variovorax paradoxus]QFZ87408.1 AbrB/MazE/SpoVT family DNA-binding domain-containing protein [Variovorax paradoxus]QOF77436.1 AbrB/MazE/SpoVT family DNA-binding domain-containing protein [Variovorax sp. 38R]
MSAIKVTQIGNSVGVILPKELLSSMNVGKGDTLYVTKASNGGFNITPYDEAFEQQMEAARRVMKKRRNVLRELAK